MFLNHAAPRSNAMRLLQVLGISSILSRVRARGTPGLALRVGRG